MNKLEQSGISPERVSSTIAVGELENEAAKLFSVGFRLGLICGHDDGNRFRATYLFLAGAPDRRVELQVHLDATRPVLSSLAHLSFPASRFEREMYDLFGIESTGHPFQRSLVLHQHWPKDWHPMRRNARKSPPMLEDQEPFPFVAVEGSGVYEIPVGPVHAGLIEPGHFRFSVVGETILKMKARLWFLHRGIEKLFEGLEVADGVAYAQRISGDSAIAHNLGYCLGVEEALGVEPSEDASRLRSILLELERIYNHIGDIGALCNDVGYSIANARALVLREKLLRLNAEITGHRLLRGAIRPGGVCVRRLPSEGELSRISEEFEELVDVAMSNTVVVERFDGTAYLSKNDAEAIGTLGIVARASGVPCDARRDHPLIDPGSDFEVVCDDSGDVLARFRTRVDEVRASIRLVSNAVGNVSNLDVLMNNSTHRPGSGVGVVEGWRGAVVHRVELDDAGVITRCKVVDPSFMNWPALSVALADTIVPDFPLANKSFNLSYAGNDL